MIEEGIVITFKGEVRKILPQEITYLENDKRKVFFYLEGDVCGTYGKMEFYEKLLPEGFYKCNQSYIINLDKVIKMGNQVIYFSDGHDIWLGKQSFCGARKAFLRFAASAPVPEETV